MRSMIKAVFGSVAFLCMLAAASAGRQQEEENGMAKSAGRSGSKEVSVTVDSAAKAEPIGLDRYGLGQGGLSDGAMIEPHVETLKWLKPKVIRLFVQEYYDVYPGHGKYNWRTLDAAVSSIIKTGAKPLMSICIKPKVLYPVVDQDKVHPASYQEWEELIGAMVRHYNVELGYGIEYWEVFNEPDIGESGGCPGRFTPEDYCTYYEHTVRAIRGAWPKAKVGGPALAYYQSPLLPALLEHCSKKGVPIDFVSWHWYTNDPQAIARSIADVKAMLAKYPSLKCETIIDEWNMSLGWDRIEHEFQPCFVAETTYQMLEAGLDRSCYYHIRDYHVDGAKFGQFMSPEANRFMTYWWNVMPQYDGIFDYQGTMRPSYFVFKSLARITGNRLAVKSDRGEVKGLAAYDADYEVMHILLWNYANERPEPCRVALKVTNLEGRKWRYYRRTFDAVTASNDENDRLRLEGIQSIEDKREISDTFDLAPYGMIFIAIKKF